MLTMPKKFFVVFKRLTILVSNNIAFTLNLRLLFTPIYGDYTKAGRAIGFFFRIGEVLTGIILIILLTIITLISPIIWVLLPIIFLLGLGVWTLILFIISTFVVWLLAYRDIPVKKVNQIKDGESSLPSFRPTSLLFVSLILSNPAGLSKDPGIYYLLKKLDLLDTDILNKLSQNTSLSRGDITKSAFELAKSHNVRYVEKEHVLYAVFKIFPGCDSLLASFNLTLDNVEDTVKWVISEREANSKAHFWQEDYEMPSIGGIGKGMTGRATPHLNFVSQDFTQMANHGLLNQIVGRREEIKKIADILGGEKVNILIIGEPGSGKTSIVKGIAQKIVTGTEYKSLKFKRIVSLDPGALVAGTNNSGTLADKLKTVMEEVKASGDIVLFIDEIENLLISENSQNGDAPSTPFAVLEPYLATNKIQFIGATNIENYIKKI